MLVKTVSIQLPETVFAALGKDNNEFVQEMRIVAAVNWYELGEISQDKAAEIAGLTRSDFFNALSRYKVEDCPKNPLFLFYPVFCGKSRSTASAITCRSHSLRLGSDRT
jgi:predicted HTH domain antitoxin